MIPCRRRSAGLTYRCDVPAGYEHVVPVWPSDGLKGMPGVPGTPGVPASGAAWRRKRLTASRPPASSKQSMFPIPVEQQRPRQGVIGVVSPPRIDDSGHPGLAGQPIGQGGCRRRRRPYPQVQGRQAPSRQPAVERVGRQAPDALPPDSLPGAGPGQCPNAAPSVTSLWPPISFVRLSMTTAAPSSNGRTRTGRGEGVIDDKLAPAGVGELGQSPDVD